MLRNLDPDKAGGPDGIPGRILQELGNEIAPSLCKLFNQSLSLGVVPTKWKFANVTPVYKKDDPTLVCNYRPISLLCILSKVMERCVFNHCYHHLSPFLYHLQHGFLRERSTVTQLLEVYHNILNSVASGKEVDIIYLDLSKAFDKVSHNLLLLKLNNYGISGPLLSWFLRNYLTDRYQRVVLDGVYSNGFLSHQVFLKSRFLVRSCSWSMLMMSQTTSASKVQLLFLLMTPNCINPLTSLALKTISKLTLTTYINGVSTGVWNLINRNVRYYMFQKGNILKLFLNMN